MVVETSCSIKQYRSRTGDIQMIEEPIAVCGIDCARCPLLKASFGDVEAAEQLVA